MAAITAGFLTLALSQPASAASAGGACTTIDATTKIGSTTFVCAKNPFFNTTKLTWTSFDCVDMYSDWGPAMKSTPALIKEAEKNRFIAIEPVGGDLKSVITWNALLPYVKGDVVYYASNYFVAKKAGTNKAPTSVNIGNTKFWVVNNPTLANAKTGQMPIPEQVISSVNKQLIAIGTLADKTTVAASKVKLNDLKTSMTAKLAALESSKGSIQTVVNAGDDAIDLAKATLNSLTLTKSILVDFCNPKYKN
jgi:ribosomal protein L18E